MERNVAGKEERECQLENVTREVSLRRRHWRKDPRKVREQGVRAHGEEEREQSDNFQGRAYLVWPGHCEEHK